jgi:two-component system phosphate regulon sensor histidine kinase PhoR
VAAFQYYWINRLYYEERDGLKKEADVVFRDVLYKLQLQRFRDDTSIFKGKKNLPDNLFLFDVIDSVKTKLMDSLIKQKIGGQPIKNVTITVSRQDTIISADSLARRLESLHLEVPTGENEPQPHTVKFFTTQKNLSDTLPVYKIDSAYKKELLKNNIAANFTIITNTQAAMNSFVKPWVVQTNVSFMGLSHNSGYLAVFENPTGYLLNRVKLPIIVSLLLLALTTTSFIFLFRNLAAQQKLTAIKNEFIGNITHELKTPIATVTVAIEALRNFNVLDNPERTREYLDISALEMKRLAMLVDKVLKLSMFENQQIQLKKENIDLLQLSAEIIAGMKLQFEKAHAIIRLTKEGDDFLLHADKLHITSVLYNLLDNALKYSKKGPIITVHLFSDEQLLGLSVTDNGIGIPAMYAGKIFQKFFRVPSGDHHNIKGYGLGLSYVHHIVTSHNGTISVTSTEGKGSTFTVKLPRA